MNKKYTVALLLATSLYCSVPAANYTAKAIDFELISEQRQLIAEQLISELESLRMTILIVAPVQHRRSAMTFNDLIQNVYCLLCI